MRVVSEYFAGGEAGKPDEVMEPRVDGIAAFSKEARKELLNLIPSKIVQSLSDNKKRQR